MNKEQILLSPITLDELETRLTDRFTSILQQSETVRTAPPEDELLTAKQTAQLLGVSLVSLHKWKKQGLVKFYRYGSRIRFKKSEILQTQKYDRRAGI